MWRQPHEPQNAGHPSLEVRARGRRLQGYAATFGTEARISGILSNGYRAWCIQGLACGRYYTPLMDHDAARLLARTKSKTLRLSEMSKAWLSTWICRQRSAGNDTLVLAERNDLSGCSFGFVVVAKGRRKTWNGNKRTLTNVDLREITASFPAAGPLTQTRKLLPEM